MIEWHIPGHPIIGDFNKAQQALADAQGVFERDFDMHHFELEPAPGQLQQYIARFSRDAPVDNLRGVVEFDELTEIPRAEEPGSVIVGRTRDGGLCQLKLLGRHTLVVGASDSGKSSIIWSAVTGLSERIARGDLILYGVDLKGGVEFTQGRHLFEQVVTEEADVIRFLQSLVSLLNDRLRDMRKTGARNHSPSHEAPDVFVIFDEAASLTYSFDAKDQKVIMGLVKQITTKGRAAGFSALAAMQDPRKEAFPARDTFNQICGLRCRTADDAKLAMGPAVYNAGAHCETIPANQPGTAYVVDIEGTGEPIRFRAFYASDEFIRSLPASAAVQKLRDPDIIHLPKLPSLTESMNGRYSGPPNMPPDSEDAE